MTTEPLNIEVLPIVIAVLNISIIEICGNPKKIANCKYTKENLKCNKYYFFMTQNDQQQKPIEFRVVVKSFLRPYTKLKGNIKI